MSLRTAIAPSSPLQASIELPWALLPTMQDELTWPRGSTSCFFYLLLLYRIIKLTTFLI